VLVGPDGGRGTNGLGGADDAAITCKEVNEVETFGGCCDDGFTVRNVDDGPELLLPGEGRQW
jgi:hypothetical protein